MSLTVPEITFILSAISSAAVIAGAFFIVFQLRQNAQLIAATLAQNRNDVAFNILGHLTDQNFVHMRKKLRDLAARVGKDGWDEFYGTLDDYELRGFALQYEILGQFVRHKIVDIDLVTHMMAYIIVTDWLAFRPFAEYLIFRFEVKTSPFIHFQWLAEKCREHIESEKHAADLPIIGV
jgi:hypothetical protein